jgi:NADH:ubiquinone oxidoreductase subunit 3 (subunit A)
MPSAPLGLATPQGWEAYSYLLVASLLGFFAPLGLAVVSKVIVAGRRRAQDNPELNEAHIRERERSPSSLGAHFNTRIYVGVNLAISFLAVVLLLLPWVLEVRGMDVRVLAFVFVLSGLLALCIWYSSRNGDLSWSTELDEEDAEGSPR